MESFMESFMESLWRVYGESMESQSREKAVLSLFSAVDRQKNQQPYFCKLLIIRAENGTRTRDLNLGKVALYQLSYFRKTR